MARINYNHFKPVTSGESLFQFIITDVIGRSKISELQVLSLLQIGGRLEEFSDYYIGVFAANLMARALKKAERLELLYPDSNENQNQLVRYIQESFEISRASNSGVLDRFAFLTMQAEKSSRRDINASTRKLSASRGLNNCYVCGRDIYEVTTDPAAKLELEHIWPQSFGGDSKVDNLLPSCCDCNREKGSMLLWQNSNVHSFVLKPSPSVDEWTSIKRKEKIAQHRRSIFLHACENKTTLKDAALAIGCVNLMSVRSLDGDDAVDFFNFNFA
ncbi:HNH endonuclease [Pseudomonas sp. MC6]